MSTLLAVISKPEGSKWYIEYNVQLATALSADLHLLYTDSPENYPLGTPYSSGQATVQVERNLEKSVTDAKHVIIRQVEEVMAHPSEKPSFEEVMAHPSEKPSFDVTTEVNSEKVVIRRMLEEYDVKMVVLENQGADSFWAGNVRTRTIIRDIDCPVWVVPQDSRFQEPDHIVYATDYNEKDVDTLIRLIRIMEQFSPTVTALHITKDVDFEMKIKEAGFQGMLQANTGYEKIHVNALTENGGDTSKLINEYTIGVSANLLVVLKQNRSFLERIFKSSETTSIVKHARVPVLVFHEQ